MADADFHSAVAGVERPYRTIYSFVIDDDPRFAYMGWHLARSLMLHCSADASDIHVQCTPEVGARTRALFDERGFEVHQIDRFGDGRFCNKLNQLNSLAAVEFDRVVLLDTDTVAIADIRPFLSETALSGVAVGLARPPIATLRTIAAATGLTELPALCRTDVSGEETFVGNCNGGLYSVPKAYCEDLSKEWRRWALWLMENPEPLTSVGRQDNIDQVSFWLALQHAALPFAAAPSNVNYHTHVDGQHLCLDTARDLALLHYHGQLDVLGLLQIPPDRGEREASAVQRANQQIGEGFDNRVFWEVRYRYFSERGSGVGSRGENLLYKRQLLREHGVEEAASVLDVGCGDLEVVKDLAIRRYVGIDQAPEALEHARRARPEWQFHLTPASDAAAAAMVLCFEVLIHQKSEAEYKALIAFLAEKTLGSLLVSGFAEDSEAIRANPFLFFHERLEDSLRRTGRFRSVSTIGAHTSVMVYRCDV